MFRLGEGRRFVLEPRGMKLRVLGASLAGALLSVGCKQEAPAPAAPPPQAAPPAPAAVTGETVSGLVKLGEGLTQADVRPEDILFVMARQVAPGGGPGPLVAVQRLTAVQAPQRFELSAKDIMVPGNPFTGPFQLSARLDRDGDPMTRTEQDLYAILEGTVNAGSKDVELVLSKGMPASLGGGAPASPGAMPPGHGAPAGHGAMPPGHGAPAGHGAMPPGHGAAPAGHPGQ
jgi:hypothetical protein